MIRENQRLLNLLHIATDGLFTLAAMPLAFWIRFFLLDGISLYPLSSYLLLAAAMLPAYLAAYGIAGLYASFRHTRLFRELGKLYLADTLIAALLLTVLFLLKLLNLSRLTLFFFLLLQMALLTVKRIAMRLLLRYWRGKGYNLKHVLLVGSGSGARRYAETIRRERELGYSLLGSLGAHAIDGQTTHIGAVSLLSGYLEHHYVDEVVAAPEADEYRCMPEIIDACEKAGIKLSVIPIFADYMPAHPGFDDLYGIPLMNIRRVPLDNLANACFKRLFDIIASLLLLVLTSPIMLAVAIGVKLSSPGPILFRQERIGRGKKPFVMYKFRSMRTNGQESTGWSTKQDPRKTPFGSFIRKFSLDEYPQFFNVLRGDMSLVGPRPEIPFYVNQFKEEIPRYMVKHQVRPGITGWAQVNGWRGDTSIRERIEFDIYYIENWTPLFDLQILLLTLVKGFVNSESLN